MRVGRSSGAASGALERKRRIRQLEGLEPDLCAVFDAAERRVAEANDAIEDARSRDGEIAGEISRLEGERTSLLSERRIRELEGLEPDLCAVFDAAERRVAEANDAIEDARSRDGEIAGEISRLEGERTSLLSEIGRMEHSLSTKLAERANLARRREDAAAAVRAAQPRVDELEIQRDEARGVVDEATRRLSDAQDDLERVRRDDSEAGSKLADAKVRLARANERVRSLSARVPELEKRLDGIDRRIRGTEQSARSLEVLRLRVDPLHDRYEALSERALDWAARLRDRASLEEADSASLKRTIEDAKAEVARAKVEVDMASSSVNEHKITRGKLEVQVDAAVKAITADGSTVLEDALRLPAPTDRAAAERELNSLVRQINNLGPLNQVAMEEYETLKNRADYIAGQLADLENARKALTKITAAIDRKMRASFLTTFEKVDENFREVFQMLFPGGQAHLEMTDPEHPADTRPRASGGHRHRGRGAAAWQAHHQDDAHERRREEPHGARVAVRGVSHAHGALLRARRGRGRVGRLKPVQAHRRHRLPASVDAASRYLPSTPHHGGCGRFVRRIYAGRRSQPRGQPETRS